MHQLIKTLLFIPVLGCFTVGFLNPHPSFGQVQPNTSLNRPMEFSPPDLGDRRSPGDRPRGGASRGGCTPVSDQAPLTALVPITFTPNGSYEAALNLTTQDHPDFWFYVPYNLDGSIPLEFVLQDKEGSIVHQTEVTPVANSAGIVQMGLPETLPPLTEGQAYRWFFIVHCDSRVPVFVEGSIEKTSTTAEMRSQLEQASPRDQAALYASEGIWQDALDTLATLYRESPSDTSLQEDWVDLLTSAGLEEVAAEPFLEQPDSASPK